MKILSIIALAAAQLAAAGQPAMAAGFDDDRAVASSHGAFAGARLRVPLGGPRAGKAQAGLTLAPVLHGQQAIGRVSTRFGEGVELRLSGETGPQLGLGGRSLAQLTEGRPAPTSPKVGISTLGWVAIGVGVAAIIVVAAGVTCQETNCLNSD